MEKVRLTYTSYDAMLPNLIRLIELEYDNVDSILALPRGGLPIGVHLAHHFGLEKISVNVDDYFYAQVHEKVLVVDDICDTGRTLIDTVRVLKMHGMENVKTAVLYHKPHAKFKPDIYVKETEEWIVFPWELMEEIPNREQYKHLGGSDARGKG